MLEWQSDPNATVIGDAAAQNPTFFSLWIGINDVLVLCLQGGDGVDHNETMNMDPSTYSMILPIPQFLKMFTDNWSVNS